MKLSDQIKDIAKKPAKPKVQPEKKGEPFIPAVDAVGGADTSIKKNLPIKEIDPARCKPWSHHNRNLLWLTPDRSGTLIESIRKDGQKQLGLVRKINGDPDFDYEIIYGVRRWYACSKIEGRRFRAEITNASDSECARLMHLENEESENITEFEKACAFKEQIDTGVFETQTQLADSLNVTNALVTRLIKAAKIKEYPDVFEVLKKDVLNISIRGASNIVDCLSDNRTKARIEKRAKELQGMNELAASKIIKELLKAANDDPKAIEKAYLSHGKKVLLNVKKSPNGKLSISVDASVHKVLGEKAKEKVREGLLQALDEML